MRSGRPVYEISGSGTAYLYFGESFGIWNIDFDLNDSIVYVHSYGTGADASCPVDVPTWKYWDGATFEVADDITVVAQILVPTPAPTTPAPTLVPTPAPTPAVPTPAPTFGSSCTGVPCTDASEC